MRKSRPRCPATTRSGVYTHPESPAPATNAINRINGGAEVVGSLAWLDVQIGRAEANGMTELVTVLSNRREVRLSSIPLIEKRQARLVEAAEFCASKGIAV